MHSRPARQVRSIADAVWYPIWDSGIRLDHSVRTVDEAVSVARLDLKAMLGLLDLRHIAGDAGLSADLRERALSLWRRDAGRRVGEMAEMTRDRWAVHGEAAFLLEPDLKESRGALRDWHALRSLAAAQLIDVPRPAVEASVVLLDARAELQRAVGRGQDVLRAQEQVVVARALGLADDDELLRRVNEAGRTLGRAGDTAWRRVLRAEARPRRFRRGPGGPDRQPLADGVVSQDGEVVLARSADPSTDPVLLLRAARVAAEHALVLAPFTLDRLVGESATLSEPWPSAARTELVALLGTGARAVPVFEALDEVGLLARLIPEWEHVRFKSQRNPVHRFTVDRHLLETAAQAAQFTRTVSRPDLLLVGALLHDIGKGYPGDHSIAGAEVAGPIATRLGFDPHDGGRIVALVRHHLLLPDTATRRDPDDPMTLTIVTDVIDGSPDLLDQLHALAIADAHATGPAAWSDWKGGLISDLVRRVHAVLAGEPVPASTPLDTLGRRLVERGVLTVEVVGDRVVVAAPHTPGLLSAASGVLALHSLDVRTASVATHAGMSVAAFTVAARFGGPPDVAVLRLDLASALNGAPGLDQRLAAKEKAYRRLDQPFGPAARVLWFDQQATAATVVELRAADSFGLLHRVTAALEDAQLDIHSARVATLGSSVIDAFYVTARDGGPVPVADRPGAADRLLAAASVPTD